MKAGRELDALIAEKVMELRKGTSLGDYDVWYYPPYKHGLIGCPHYSTRIADAWLVWIKLGELIPEPKIMKISNGDGDSMDVNIIVGGLTLTYSSAHICLDGGWELAPLAICLAALEAVSDLL